MIIRTANPTRLPLPALEDEDSHSTDSMKCLRGTSFRRFSDVDILVLIEEKVNYLETLATTQTCVKMLGNLNFVLLLHQTKQRKRSSNPLFSIFFSN